jgi:hypothetical protein
MLQPSVQSYLARAQLFDAQGKVDAAMADFRQATELKPANVFDTAAQALAKSRIEQLARGNSCGGKDDQRCL